MNTGIQRSSSTLRCHDNNDSSGKKSFGQATQKKNMPKDSGCPQYPLRGYGLPFLSFDFSGQDQEAKAAKGPAYIHVLSVCPTGWRITSDQAIHYGRLAVRTGFPALRGREREIQESLQPETVEAGD
jgi:pyruvate ferredoxin oxidoreductase beta subunit